MTHSRAHRDFSRFARREVIVIGGGQSALETGALLNESGARVQLLVRKPYVEWNPHPSVSKRPWRFAPPHTPLGLDWRAWFYCYAPGVFYYLPQKFRGLVVRRALGPAGAWWLKSRVLGQFQVQCGRTVRKAREIGGKIRLAVNGADGRETELTADHVIAATGYRVDVNSLPFLASDLVSHLRLEGAAPAISPSYETSIPGLYFAGLASATQFGPAMRFVFGAEYTARKIAPSVRPIARKSHASDSGASRPVSEELVPAGKRGTLGEI